MFVNVYDSIMHDSVFISIANIKIIHFFKKKTYPHNCCRYAFFA